MWSNMSVGLITIASYTIDMGGKCLVFFFDNEKNDLFEVWIQLSSCVAALGFFLAGIFLISIFKSYTVALAEEKIRSASRSGTVNSNQQQEQPPVQALDPRITGNTDGTDSQDFNYQQSRSASRTMSLDVKTLDAYDTVDYKDNENLFYTEECED